MLLRLLSWSVRVLCALLIALFLYVNVQLYDAPECAPVTVDADLLGQLRFLQRMLHEQHAGEAAQSLYPEGFIFIHALYALAWCDAVADLPLEHEQHQLALTEVSFSLQQMESPTGKQVFSAELPLPYGAFYRGWTAYVRGRFLQLGGRDSLISAQFEEDCAAIATSIIQTEDPYLTSYHGLSWPADNVVCLAALALHDRIFEPNFEAVRAIWLERIKSTLIIDYQLIPHGYELTNKQPLGGVRGSSQVLMLAFLPEIDSTFSQLQYQQFRKHFLVYKMGLPGVREYPNGSSGAGDIDSGPVIMGIGGVASIVGIRAALQHGDWAVAAGLRNGTGALLFPISTGTEQYYLFGQLPMLDAFIAWANAGNYNCPPVEPEHWRWKFQLISLAVLLSLVWVILKTGTTRH